MCVRVLSEQNESLINAGLAEVSLQEFFISHNMRDDRLVNFTSQFLKAFFYFFIFIYLFFFIFFYQLQDM